MIHLITGEYPPAVGGVADYTAEVAAALVTAGAVVHVWCPGEQREPTVERDVTVHRALAAMGAADLQRMDAQLDRFLAPRRLLVQWVPHAFGQRSMNLGFCRWLARRAGAGDCVEIMVHEPFLPFAPRPRQFLTAAVHRVMTIVLLRAARMVWVATPAWEARWRPYALGRNLPFQWLPEPASVPIDPCAAGRAASIRMKLVPPGGCVIGAFSTASPFAREMLAGSVPMALERSGPCRAAARREEQPADSRRPCRTLSRSRRTHPRDRPARRARDSPRTCRRATSPCSRIRMASARDTAAR